MLNYWGFTYTYMIFNEDWSRGKSWHNTISLDVFVTQLAGKSNCYEIKLIVFQIDRVIYSILRNLPTYSFLYFGSKNNTTTPNQNENFKQIWSVNVLYEIKRRC